MLKKILCVNLVMLSLLFALCSCDSLLPSEPVTQDEWMTAFDSDKYQSYTMEINGTERSESGYFEEINITIQFKNPYFKITSLTTEGNDSPDGWLNKGEATSLISGGIEELEKTVYIPNRIASFYDTISEMDNFGYSKFLFDSEKNTYSSSLFDGFESVEISIKNTQLETISLTREYTDHDFGDTTAIYTLKLSSINATAKPEISKKEVNNTISEAKNSINNATDARKGYQSSTFYDLDEAIYDFNIFLNDLLSQNNIINSYDVSKYSWEDFEADEYDEETYIEIDLSCPESRHTKMLGQSIEYDTICMTIQDDRITSVALYNNSNSVFSIYFFY